MKTLNPIEYFPATPAHLHDVVTLRIAFLIDLLGPQPDEKVVALETALTAQMGRLMADGTYIAWLAAQDGQIVGGGGMSIREQPGGFSNLVGRGGYLMSMFTVPEYRGRGICSTLVNKLMMSAQEAGITHFELHATKAGEPVYQKLGFMLHDEPTYRKTIAD